MYYSTELIGCSLNWLCCIWDLWIGLLHLYTDVICYLALLATYDHTSFQRKLGCKSPRKSLQAVCMFLFTVPQSLDWGRWDEFLSRTVMKAVMKHNSGVGIKVLGLLRRQLQYLSEVFLWMQHFRLVLKPWWTNKTSFHGRLAQSYPF